MLHYDTPALSHLYFVDPQWLCDMLAHIVTVPEVNRFIQRAEGMSICTLSCGHRLLVEHAVNVCMCNASDKGYRC